MQQSFFAAPRDESSALIFPLGLCLILFPGRLLKGHLGTMLVGFTAAAGACSPVGARRCALPPGACVGFLSRSREQRVTPTDGSESTGGVAANAALSLSSVCSLGLPHSLLEEGFQDPSPEHRGVWSSEFLFVCFFQNCQRELPVLSSAVQSRAASRQRRNIGSNSFNMLSRWKLINTCKDIFVVKICAARSLQW